MKNEKRKTKNEKRKTKYGKNMQLIKCNVQKKTEKKCCIKKMQFKKKSESERWFRKRPSQSQAWGHSGRSRPYAGPQHSVVYYEPGHQFTEVSLDSRH
jgi:hypothetical protein